MSSIIAKLEDSSIALKRSICVLLDGLAEGDDEDGTVFSLTVGSSSKEEGEWKGYMALTCVGVSLLKKEEAFRRLPNLCT